MKRTLILGLTALFFRGFLVFAQTSIPEHYIPFENLNYTPEQCFQIWSNAGSNTYKTVKKPYLIIDAKQNYNLKTDGTDNKDLAEKIELDRIKYPTGLLVIYFPSGTYRFDSPIVLNNLNNILLKGESWGNTKFYFNHWESGILIEGSDKIGIEDIHLDRRTDLENKPSSLKDAFNVQLSNASDCWVSGIYSTNAFKAHIRLDIGSSNNTITGCGIDNALAHGDGGQGYGIMISGGYNSLIENNLLARLRHSILLQNNPYFNVIAYNASFEVKMTANGGDANPGKSDLTFHGRINGEYYPGPVHNLIEGNRFEYVRFDRTHGSNGPHNTFLRNIFNHAFDITDICTEKCEYPFDAYHQHHQNVIGCEGISLQDRLKIDGTKEYIDLFGDYTPQKLPSNITSYYTWNQMPPYLPSWPYIPGGSFNGAQNRAEYGYYEDFYWGKSLTIKQAVPQPEGWDKYFCGPLVGEFIVLDQSQLLSSVYLKASNEINASLCTVKSGAPSVFTAGEIITLAPGFTAEYETDFTAYIDPDICQNSGKQMIASDNAFPSITPEPINTEQIKSSLASSSQEIVEEITEDNLLNIYPNPFTNELGIKFSIAKGNTAKIIVHNSLMQPVYTYSKQYDVGGNYELSQSLSQLASGIYTVHFSTENFSKAVKVIKAD